MNQIALGRWNTLTITRRVDFGVYLDGGEVGEVLMPLKYVPRGAKEGDEVEAFVYLDQQERLIATREKPLAQVGEFAFLQVAWVNRFGAFLSWGVLKDVFVPFREQKMRMEQGRSYVVRLYIDEETSRIVASAKVERFLSQERPPYRHGDKVEALVWQKTDLGFKVIVDNRYSGLLYENQVFTSLCTGYRVSAYVQHVREDNRLDLILQQSGMEGVDDFSEKLLARIKEEGGFLPFSDKTSPQVLNEFFGVSKKTFKRALGTLYKQQLITLTEEGVRLTEED